MQRHKEWPPAVILSGNLGERVWRWAFNEIALALVRSLGRRGVPVYRFHPDRSLADLTSRYCEHRTCPNLYDDAEGLRDTLVDFARGISRPAVLFPASDGAAQFIADHEEVLRRSFALTCPSSMCISRTQNKRRLLEIAAAAGIPVPETHFPTGRRDVDETAQIVCYPVIIKPLFSPDWKRAEVQSVFGFVKALKVWNHDQLKSLCDVLFSLSSQFMIQEIVAGPDENLLTFLGYIGRDGEVLAGCVRKKLRQFPPGFGYCCLTETVDDREVFDLAVRLLKALNYRGIGCVEFKRDPRNGEAKLIEINTRAVRTSALAIAAGVDFPWIAYQDAVYPGTVTPVLNYDIPVRWVHLQDELRAAVPLLLQRRLSVAHWMSGFRGKRLVAAEFSWDDMYPALLLWSQLPVKLLKFSSRRIRQHVRPERQPHHYEVAR